MTSLAELERYLAEEAEGLPAEADARAKHLTTHSRRSRSASSFPYGLSVSTAAFAALLIIFAIPVVWVGFMNGPPAGDGSNAPDVSTAAEGQITTEALLEACPNCDDRGRVFIVTSLYESGSPLSEFVRPMSGTSVQSISATLPGAVFTEADTDEAAAAYEEAGNRQALVVTFSPVTYPTETSATISVGVIWGTSVTETLVEFHWNGSDWIRSD